MNIKLTHKISRSALTLLVMLTMTLTASATDFITDVMVAGNKNESQFNTLIQDLQGQGWTDINQDLNQGCGSGSAYIHLLYKKQSSLGNTGTPITGFYIKTGVSSPAASIEHDGRTYYLVPCQGSDSFVNGHGDLNAGCGSNSAYIFLYYTKDALSNNTGVTGITFNTTQSGAVGENGGSTGYDLNTGCGSGSAYIYMHLTTASGANVVTLCSGSGEVQLLNGHILTGTGGANTHVTIADGATVTLSGVNITAITNNSSHQWPGISCLGNATIVLGGSTTNTVKGGYQSSGIYVPEYKTLTLQGSGTLNATGSQKAAGIGSSYGNSCGNITINSGTVNATGGQWAAGIGSGCENSSCGSIYINGGTVAATGGEDAAGIGSGSDRSDCWHIRIYNTVTQVTATKGTNCNNAIGAGRGNSTCQSVTIGDVETGFITQSPFVTFPYTVAFDANGGTNSMSSQSFMYNVAQNLFGNFFSRTNYEFVGWATSADGPKVYDDEQSVNNLTATSGATVTLYAKWKWIPIVVTLTTESGEVLLQDGDMFNGTGGANTHVTIADGATVTFSGVNITDIANNSGHQWAGITCLGDATIVLAGGTTNNVKGGYLNSGIYIPESKTLTLQGSGTLNATGSEYAAGIGGGYGQSCGNITLAHGVTVTATKGAYGDYAIGAGTCGTVKIGGVKTGPIAQSPFITYPYTVAFDANGGTGTMADQAFMYNVAQSLTATSFTYPQLTFDGWATSPDGPKEYEDEESVINLTSTSGATATLHAKWRTHLVTLTPERGNVKLYDGDTLTGTGGANTRVKIVDGATVTISGVDITAIANNNSHQWAGITCLGDAVIVLDGGTTNSVKGGNSNPGIYVPQNKTLTLQGNGTLNAIGSDYAAGIGSGFDQPSCGDITISGGNVTATGGKWAAGIGGGYYQSCGNITINSGTVNATGGEFGAGIGSGSDHSNCGNVTISGGNVTANGGKSAAGIGSGSNYSNCGNITITNGVNRVTATKGETCDNAIGAGVSSTCGTVTIDSVQTGFIAEISFTTFPYTVAFDANGGTGAMDTMSFMYSFEQNLTVNNFTRINCEFEGWATSANGPKVYDDGQSVSNLTETTHDTVTLYAKWSGSPITLTKNISGYGTGTGGWHLIASPLAEAFTPTAENGFLTSTYDLYRFNQGSEQEWENWKQSGDHYHFNIESGQGYLYANQAGTTLTFSGMPYTGNGQIALTKTAVAQLEGWNLVGNPFGTAATLGIRPFYRMNTLGTEIIASETNTVAAMEGIFVVAAEDGEMVTFTEATRAADNGEERIVINVSGPSTGSTTAVIDRAIIRFDEGQTLPKFQIRENSTKVYIPQEGKDYAVVNANGTNEIPVHFKAAENDTYTLTFSSENIDFNYLHFIDNLTGTDVNLLASNGGDAMNRISTYTFEGKTSDYESRFKLVFSTNDEDGPSTSSGAFAYIHNSDIIINGEGTLQVMDVMGRVVVCRDALHASAISTSGMAPGVYVLRLIDSDVVRTQKIVVE